MTDIDDLGPILSAAITAHGKSSARSKQSDEGILGPSDIGFCRNLARLKTIGIPPTDSPPIWSAQVGTAIHTYIAEALGEFFPRWILDDTKVTATLPSGAQISGTPDIIAPDYNAIIDIKTVDGFSWVKNKGVSQAHLYQRHLYALGAIQAGLLDDTKPIYVANLYLDRSGKDPDPYFVSDLFDPSLTMEIDVWVTDVTYAVQHQEEASKDVAASVCERICDRFTACRGGLPAGEGGEWIEDPVLIDAIDLYNKSRAMAKQADQMKMEAQAALVGVNGRTKDFQVRWTTVNPTEIPGYVRRGYEKMEIIKVRDPK